MTTPYVFMLGVLVGFAVLAMVTAVTEWQEQARQRRAFQRPAMRAAWRSASEALGLSCACGYNAFGDAIFGVVNGFPVLVRYLPNEDAQKPETTVTLSLPRAVSVEFLRREQVLDLYDKTAPVGGDSALSDEARAWFLGKRTGVGLFLDGEVLRYHQLYSIDEAATLQLLLPAMAQCARRLTHG
jgi:hypothetical protein